MMQLGGFSPWLQCLHESLEMVSSRPWGHACLDLLWWTRKAENCWDASRCSQLWEELEMGLQRKIHFRI